MKFIFASVVLLMTAMNSKAQYWEPFAGGITCGGSGVRALTVDTFHNYLWVGGGFCKVDTTEAHNVVIWNGTKWKRLPVEPEGVITALAMKGDTLFAASGDFVFGDQQVYEYVDTTFIQSFQSGYINCLYVYHDTLFAGDEYGYIKFWDGITWYEFAGGVSGNNTEVNAIGEYNGQLIVAGHFDHANGVTGFVNNIVSWDGSAWHKLGEGVTSAGYPIIYALQEFNGELYVGGDFDDAGSLYAGGIAKWNGVSWDTVVTYLGQYNCGVTYDMFHSQDRLYVSGTISGTGDICMGQRAAIFDGINWFNLNLSSAGYGFAITVFDSDIIAGTDFSHTLGSDTVNYIGHYIGAIPTFVSPIEPQIISLIYPNPASSTIKLHLASSQPTLISIFNLLGEKMKEEKVSGNEVTIDVSELPAGMYVVRSNENLVGKFVKE